MAREFIPRLTGAEQLDQVQADVQQAIRAVKDQAPTPDQVTTFVESRAASLNDRVLAFKGPTGQTLTLAPAALPEKGRVRQLLVLNFATVALTIAAPIGDTIDGAQSVTLPAGKSAQVYTDGETKHLAIIGFGQADISFPAAPAEGTGHDAWMHAGAFGAREVWKIVNQVSHQNAFTTAYAPGNDLLRAFPFIAPKRGGTIDRIAFECTTGGTAGATALVGVYTNTSPTNLYPAAKVVEMSGASDAAAVVAGTVSGALTGGELYWMVMLTVTPGVSATFRSMPINNTAPLLGYATPVGSTIGTTVANRTVGWTVAHVPDSLPSAYPAGATALDASGIADIPAIAYRIAA